MNPHNYLAIIVLALTATSGTVHADVSSHPCMMALAQGSLEERRAQFSQALALFEQARKEPACEVEAQIGMARTFNSMNDHKDAVVAAKWVLDHSDDPELQAEAHYEIGRALHKPGRRMTTDKTAAAEALLQAVELSEGRHHGAVRALMRLYEETRQEDRLAEIQERYPDIRASTRARQVRAVAPKKKSGPVAGKPGPVIAEGSVDCSTRKVAPSEDWELDLPRFCGSGPDRETGDQPRKLSSPTPEYPEEDRKARTQGTVKFEALVGIDGEVEAVRIVDGVSPGLDAATIASACQWRWEPSQDADGRPSRFYICGGTSFRVQ